MPSARQLVQSMAILAVLLSVSPLRAALVGANFITITASDGTDNGEWKVPIPLNFEFPANGIYHWDLPSQVLIRNANQTKDLATIQSLSVEFHEDPSVLLNFNATAGAAVTNFTISSAVVNFPALNNPDAFATSAMTVTDNNGDGATLTGMQTGAKAYMGTYNGSVDWALLNSTFAAGANASNISNDRRPVAGFETIADNVSSIQAQFKFSLTPFDAASATSNFTVVPEPSAVLLGLLGAVCLFRRK